MVYSKINPEVSYAEWKRVEGDDLKRRTDLFDMPVNGVDLVVAVGRQKSTYADQNVLFYPLYMINERDRAIQIGVFEISAMHPDRYLDDTGQLDLEQVEDPLLYEFATRDYLLRERLNPEGEEYEDVLVDRGQIPGVAEAEKAEMAAEVEKAAVAASASRRKDTVSRDIPDKRRDLFEAVPGATMPVVLPEESAEDAERQTTQFNKHGKGHTWIADFLQNNHYSITDNAGKGDCFFLTIVDAFASIGQRTTVSQLRVRLAENVTEERYLHYKKLYAELASAQKSQQAEYKELCAQYEKVRTAYDNKEATSMEQRNALEIQAKHMHEVKCSDLSARLDLTKQLVREFAYMKNIHTFDQFRQFIKSSDYWADAADINTMERILGVKFIILNSDMFKEGDLNNVLQCGELSDVVLNDTKLFHPEYYILLSYSSKAQHYALVGYKGRYIFKWREVPYHLKTLIVSKCMEQNAGPFAIIPEVMDFKTRIRGADKKSRDRDVANEVAAAASVVVANEWEGHDLYTNDIVFQFYNKSVSKPPGKGAGDEVSPNLLGTKEFIDKFAALAKIKEWRRMLSVQWPAAFTLDGHRWQTVEHYLQANKFKGGNPHFYALFTLDAGAGEKLATDPEYAKAAGSAKGVIRIDGENIRLRPKNVGMDADFATREGRVLYEGNLAKYRQHKELREMLLATQDAKLMQYVAGEKAYPATELMRVREKIKREP